MNISHLCLGICFVTLAGIACERAEKGTVKNFAPENAAPEKMPPASTFSNEIKAPTGQESVPTGTPSGRRVESVVMNNAPQLDLSSMIALQEDASVIADTNWVSDCEPRGRQGLKQEFNFNQKNYEMIQTYFWDSNCLNPFKKLVFKGEMVETGESAELAGSKKIDFKLTDARLRLDDAPTVTDAKRTGLFNHKDWILGEEKNILNQKINSYSQDIAHPAGQMKYLMMKWNSRLLLTTLLADTPEARSTPEALQNIQLFKRK